MGLQSYNVLVRFILTELRLDYSFGKALPTSGLRPLIGHACPRALRDWWCSLEPTPLVGP